MNWKKIIGTYWAAWALSLSVASGVSRINEVGDNMEHGFHEARDAEEEFIATAMGRIRKTKEVFDYYEHSPDIQILWWSGNTTKQKIDSSQLGILQAGYEQNLEDSEALRDSMTGDCGFFSFFKLAAQYDLGLSETIDLLVEGDILDRWTGGRSYDFEGSPVSYVRTWSPEKQIEEYLSGQRDNQWDRDLLENSLKEGYWEEGIFDEKERPKIIRLHFVREEIIAA